MNSNLPLLKALATTLLSEIDSLGDKSSFFAGDEPFNLHEKVREFEIKLIKTALIKTGGNQRRAAHLLGIKGTTLHNKIRVYNIQCLKIVPQ